MKPLNIGVLSLLNGLSSLSPLLLLRPADAIEVAWMDDLINGRAGSQPGSFPSWNETSMVLNQLNAWNPLFSAKFPLGVSYECRIMWGYWVSGMGAANREASRQRVKYLRDNFLRSIYEEEAHGIEERCFQESDQAPNPNREGSTLRDLRFVLSQAQQLPERNLVPVSEDNGSKGRLLMTALHHAREPTSLTASMHVYRYLLGVLSDWYRQGDHRNPIRGTGQVDSPQATVPSMLLNREVLFLPFVNPDGYVAIQRTGNRNIRKNQRPTCSANVTFHVSALNGVDLNRNYGTSWVNKHNKCDPEEYEGAEAFSEPETRAVRRAASVFGPKVALNFHSYGDVWTRPWNCCKDRALSESQNDIFNEVKSVLRVDKFGSAPELTALSYLATGEADDYLMDAHDIISLSPEVGPEDGGFYPSAKAVRQINIENTPRVLRMLLKSGSEISATLAASQCRGGSLNASGIGPNWNLILFNSGLENTGPARINLKFFAGEISTETEADMRMGFYDDGHFKYFRSLAPPLSINTTSSSFNAPSTLTSIPTRVVSAHEMDQVEGDADRGTVNINIKDGIAPREQYELSLSHFDMTKAQPSIVEICISQLVDRQMAVAPQIARAVAAAGCSCGQIQLSTAKGGCPFGKTALHIAPEIPQGHECAKIY